MISSYLEITDKKFRSCVSSDLGSIRTLEFVLSKFSTQFLEREILVEFVNNQNRAPTVTKCGHLRKYSKKGLERLTIFESQSRPNKGW